MRLSLKSKIAIFIAVLSMLLFFAFQSAVVFKYKEPSHVLSLIGFYTMLVFLPFFFLPTIEFVRRVKFRFQDVEDTFKAIDSSNLVAEFNTRGEILSCNVKFANLLGYKISEIILLSHYDFIDSTKINKKQIDEFWTHLRIGRFKQDEYRLLTAKGEEVWIYGNFNPIKNPYDETYKIIMIATDITDRKHIEIESYKKTSYLEHAAKILRHDMHSGINTYIPRGLSSLKRRLTEEQIKELKIDPPIRMIEEGLIHTQKVYKGVKEFTNLVKADAHLDKELCDLKEILHEYLSSTSYEKQVIISDLPKVEVNESLFCTAVDNLIRNGLKYNDSSTKIVQIYSEGDYLIIQDNGRGMSQEEFILLSQPYVRKQGQVEQGTGLGLNICIAIMKEHAFQVSAEKLEIGTKLKIKII
jgi:PAS domain S-box-containing protein